MDKTEDNIVSVVDVVKYIIECIDYISKIKINQLLYYCQAWSLVWDGQPLFYEKIEAWANNPIVPKLWYLDEDDSDDLYSYCNLRGKSDKLKHFQKETIYSVLKHYNYMSSQELRDLICTERPWKDSRVGLTPDIRGSSEITHKSMREYYTKIANYSSSKLDYDSLIKELESTDNLEECTNSSELLTVELILPTKMVKLLEMCAKKEDVDLNLLIKKWLDETLKTWSLK